MTAARRIDALTGVRGFAAWLVVLYHIRGSLALPAPVIAVLARGYLAVDLFFVLSGFVLWLTWQQRFAADGPHAVAPFLAKRIARVWPLHAAILAATVAFALTLELTGRPLPAHYRWSELPLHVVLMQNWGFTRDLGWNDPSWSISTEVAAYIAFAVGLALLGRRRAPGVAVPVAVIVLLVAVLDRVFAWHGLDTLGGDITRLGLIRCLVEFTCGVCGCMIWQRASARATIGTSGVVVVTAVALWLMGTMRETMAVPLAFAALVPLLAATSAAAANPLSSRFALWLGEVSYSTYLAHFLLWTVFKIVAVPDASAVPWPVIALYLALTLLASVVLHRFVEVPGRRLPELLPSRRRAAQNPTSSSDSRLALPPALVVSVDVVRSTQKRGR